MPLGLRRPSGGFAEEAPPLISKAIGQGAAARLADLGELADGAAMATPGQIRALVERGLLLPRALEALTQLLPVASATPEGAGLAALFEVAEEVLAGCHVA